MSYRTDVDPDVRPAAGMVSRDSRMNTGLDGRCTAGARHPLVTAAALLSVSGLGRKC